MTEQEAQELARKLEWIWGPIIATERVTWKLTEECFRFSCLVADDMHVSFIQELKTGEMHIELCPAPSNQHFREKEYSCGLLCFQAKGKVAVIHVEHASTFSVHYLPLFRCNCWLSGFNIEATAHEKVEWAQEFDGGKRNAPVFDEKCVREVRRIAAALGVEQWSIEDAHGRCRGTLGEFTLRWVLYQGELVSLFVQEGTKLTHFLRCRRHGWSLHGEVRHYKFLARGLYRLGLEKEATSHLLPPLTDSEKLELCLSPPREFWPPNWLDEEEV